MNRNNFRDFQNSNATVFGVYRENCNIHIQKLKFGCVQYFVSVVTFNNNLLVPCYSTLIALCRSRALNSETGTLIVDLQYDFLKQNII